MQEIFNDVSLPRMDRHDFSRFRTLVQEKTGIYLRDGKQVMLASRLNRRMRHHRITTFNAYYDFLMRQPDGSSEMGEFINCVTTNKTSFFRESHHFQFLSDTIVPEFRKSARGRQLRIWSAACSTGEEPYSIAITLQEATHGECNVEIIASDIDTTVLRTAQCGVYPGGALDSVKPALHSRYFLRGRGDMAGQVKVKPELAGLVHFRRVNLIDPAWPIEGLFDAIFFRNALIYFDQQTQDVFLRRMLRYLRPNGYLFLGHSEHVPWLHHSIELLSQTVYRLRPDGRQTSEPDSSVKVPSCR